MIIGLDINNKKMKCSYCLSEIRKKYYRIDQYEIVICESCYKKNHRCQVCLLPTQEIFLVHDMKVCSDCYSLKYSCRSCSRELSRKEDSKVIHGQQGFFCISCYNSKNKCTRCHFPAYTNDKLLVVDHDIILCDNCQSSSVLSEDIAKTVLLNISRILHQKMNIQQVKNIILKFVSKKELFSIIENSPLNPYKNYNSEQLENIFGFTKREGNVFKISIINGLKLSSFISTMTYEYARCWQLQNCSKQIGRILWEGFSKWTAIKMLYLLGYHDEIKTIESREYIDGFGLKKIQVIEKSKGMLGVLEFMTQAK